MVLRMLADMPYQKYYDTDEDGKPKKKAENIKLTPQTSADFKKHIEELNKKIK